MYVFTQQRYFFFFLLWHKFLGVQPFWFTLYQWRAEKVGSWRNVHCCYVCASLSWRHRLGQNGIVHGGVLTTCKSRFLTNKAINRPKNCCECRLHFIACLSVGLFFFRLEFPLTSLHPIPDLPALLLDKPHLVVHSADDSVRHKAVRLVRPQRDRCDLATSPAMTPCQRPAWKAVWREEGAEADRGRAGHRTWKIGATKNCQRCHRRQRTNQGGGRCLL